MKLLTRLLTVSVREGARFVAVSQPFAGSFLNAVPKYEAFRLPTWALRIVLQRRLGLPLTAAAAAAAGGNGRRSRRGKVFDAMGDVATNDGEAGHQTRHYLILNALYDALRRVYGAQVSREPGDYCSYSDHRPDLTLLLEGALRIFDLKVLDPLGAEASGVGARGAFVAFGNTEPRARAMVLGRAERAGEGVFNPNTGGGHVSPVDGDYARAQGLGMQVAPLLVEPFGGLGADLVGVLRAAAAWRADKLEGSEYDETTWAARSWTTFATQRISVAVHYSAAFEIANALGLATAADPRVGCVAG